MEVTATASTNGSQTVTSGSRTIADLIPRAAAVKPEHAAMRYKRDGAWHDVRTVKESAGPPGVYDIVGPICESGDFLAKSRTLAAAQGDLLAVMSAGAYAMSMSSNYNSRPRAAEVLVDGGAAHLVRARESVAQLFALERIPG